MLRFNNRTGIIICYAKEISIHLMLRFNCDVCSKLSGILEFQYILCYGSTRILNTPRTPINIFQYILCYGSTLHKFVFTKSFMQFQYILCYGSTVLEIAKYSAKGKFQYILCYGSTNKTLIKRAYKNISIHLMLRFNLLHLCILYFSSYQIVVAVSTFFIIFSNDKYFFSQKSKTSLKA